jgi:hypothetical protein
MNPPPPKNSYLQYIESVVQSMPSNPTLAYMQGVMNNVLDEKWDLDSGSLGGDGAMGASTLVTVDEWYKFAIDVNGALFQDAPSFATFSAAVEPLVVSWLAAKVAPIPTN